MMLKNKQIFSLTILTLHQMKKVIKRAKVYQIELKMPSIKASKLMDSSLNHPKIQTLSKLLIFMAKIRMIRSSAKQSVSSNMKKQILKNNLQVIIFIKLTSSNSQTNLTTKLPIQPKRREKRKDNTKTKNQKVAQMTAIVALKSAVACAASTFSLSSLSNSNRSHLTPTTLITKLKQ